jgi:hypothetical protein
MNTDEKRMDTDCWLRFAKQFQLSVFIREYPCSSVSSLAKLGRRWQYRKGNTDEHG